MDTEIFELVQRAQKGQKDAFSELYKIFSARLYRFAYSLVGTRQQSEDVVQNSFLKAWQKLGEFSPSRGTFSGWLFRIAHNLAVDELRQKKEYVLDEWNEPPSSGEPNEPLAQAVLDEEKQDLSKALADLKESEKEVIVLHYFEEFTTSEIAGILGKREGATRVQIHRAVKKLGEKIKNYGS